MNKNHEIAYRILVGKPEGMKPLGRPGSRLEDIIKMDVWKVSCDAGDCIDIAQDRVQWQAYVRTIVNLRVP